MTQLRTLKADYPHLLDEVVHHDCGAALLEQQDALPQAVGTASSSFTDVRWRADTVVRNIAEVAILQPPITDS